MAVAFDTASNGATASSWSHTCSGSNRALVVFVHGDVNGATNAASATYNSVSMTQVDAIQISGDRTTYAFLLINPASGSNTIAITGPSFIRGLAASYTGCAQSSQPDGHISATVSSTSLSANLTVTAKDCWAILHSYSASGANSGFTGVISTTRGSTLDGGLIGDSNGNVSSGSDATGFTNSTSALLSLISISLAPANPAIDSTANSTMTAWTAGTSLSWTHTTTAGLSNSIGVALIQYIGTISSVTWDGVAMTQAIFYTDADGAQFYAYIILSPAAGAKTILVNYSDNQPFHMGASFVLSGAFQSTTPDATGTAHATSGTTFAIPITTVTDNSQVVAMFYNNSGATMTAGSGTTIDATDTHTGGYGHITSLSTPAGAQNVNLASSSGHWTGIAVSIAPAAVPFVPKVGSFLSMFR